MVVHVEEEGLNNSRFENQSVDGLPHSSHVQCRRALHVGRVKEAVELRAHLLSTLSSR